MTDEPFRQMTPRERALIARLLKHDFPGRDALRLQLSTARVQSKHPQQDECLRFEVTDQVPAATLSNVPVRGMVDAGEGVPPTDFALFIGKDGIAYSLENTRDVSESAPAIEDIHPWYQQRDQYLYLPEGVLTPDYVPSGLYLGNGSHSTDFNHAGIPSRLEVSMRRLDNDRSIHLVVRQLRNYVLEAPSNAQTLSLRGKTAWWWIDDNFLKLEWTEEPRLLVQLQTTGIPLHELIAVAESLRRAKSTG